MHLITARKGRKAVCVMSEHTIFRKWKKTAAGKLFATYLTTLKMKDGGSRTVAVRFTECDAPAAFPVNINVDKKDANLATKTYTRQDGTEAEAQTLWIRKYTPGSEYQDTSLDDVEF